MTTAAWGGQIKTPVGEYLAVRFIQIRGGQKHSTVLFGDSRLEIM